MTIRAPRQHIPKTTIEGISGMKKRMLVNQVSASTSKVSVYTIAAAPQPPTNAFSNGSTLLVDLDFNETSIVADLDLRFTISASGGDVQLVPASHLVKTIILESAKSVGSEICRFYPENIVFWEQLTENDEQRHKNHFYRKSKRISKDVEGTEKYTSASAVNTIPDTKSRDFYIKVPLGLIPLQSFDLTKIKNGLRFRIECASGSDVVLEGSVANLSLDSVHMIVKSVDLDGLDVQALDQEYKYPQSTLYLDVERLVETKALTAGSETHINIDEFNGKVAFLLVLIRPTSTTGITRYKYYELGPDAEFDLLGASGYSKLANGTPIKESWLYQHFVDQLGNKPLSGFYLIPFTEDVKASLAGSLSGGYKQFTTTMRDQLSIKPDNNGTSAVATISHNNSTNTAGYYRVGTTKGYMSGADLAYNATTTNIKDNFEAIPEVAKLGFSVTIGSSFDSSGSSTFTFHQHEDGDVFSEIGIPTIIPYSLNNSGTNDYVTSSVVTTDGRRGFVDGSYSIEIHAYKFRELTITPSGSVHVRDI